MTDDALVGGEAHPLIVERPGVRVELVGVDGSYGEAFARIMEEARQVYAEQLHLPMPELLTLEIKLGPEHQTAFWTDGRSGLFLTLSGPGALAPSTRGGPRNPYGACHEMAHIAMHRGLADTASLPRHISEGWAHWAGTVVIDEVAARLGEAIWPEAYDVRAEEGAGPLERDFGERSLDGSDALADTVSAFVLCARRYGRGTVGRAMAEAVRSTASGGRLTRAFVDALARLVGDPDAGAWIPAGLVAPATDWWRGTAEDALFSDLRAEPDETGHTLAYDDGVSGGMCSLGGSGHATLFRSPEGEWSVDRVRVYGSRYGPEVAPDKPVRAFVCDEGFEPLGEARCPQPTFERGEPAWYDIELPEPVAVCERFYICLSFDPTGEDGVHVHYVTNAAHSHSRDGLPGSHLNSPHYGSLDWMVRAHLVPSTPATAPA